MDFIKNGKLKIFNVNALDFILLSLIIFSIFIGLLFLWAKLIRLFKKKNFHHLVPPDPEKDHNWYPVDLSNYNSYVFVNNQTEESLNETLSYFFISEDAFERLKEEIELIKHKTWIILKIGSISFYELKTLVYWLIAESEVDTPPSEVIGFCKNKSNPLQDYIFKMDADPELEQEYFIGSFRHGKNFGIYLPKANLNKSGNISLSRNHEIDFYSELSKLPSEQIEMPIFSDEKPEKF